MIDWNGPFSPHPPQQPTIDIAQFVALSAVVRALVGSFAIQREGHSPGAGVAWINAISTACQDAIATGVSGPNGQDVESIRERALEYVNEILRTSGAPIRNPPSAKN
jgi:hypothetical protein